MSAPIHPHDFARNVVRIPVSKNPQKQRKPNGDVSRREKTYWDLRGRHQREYDERLDALPDEGVSSTVAGEIFRAATKLYYDFHNNAMVNNTSGAIKFLQRAGVFAETDDVLDAFDVLYPYTTGARIHFGELEPRRAVEALLDATLLHLSSHPELDDVPNEEDFHDLCDRDERSCLEHCSICIRMARDMAADAKRRVKRARKHSKRAQGYPRVGSKRLAAGIGKENCTNGKKRGKGRREAQKKESKMERDVATNFSKLALEN